MTRTATLNEKIIDAESKCSKWLADGNEYDERGNAKMAERCWEKSQYWRDRYNKLSGNA